MEEVEAGEKDDMEVWSPFRRFSDDLLCWDLRGEDDNGAPAVWVLVRYCCCVPVWFWEWEPDLPPLERSCVGSV